ncbi:uncharacterized protein [Acropora muricata]|uniref:uncharacterized protein isoform X2 n=1 Tax=Acropora muricata TaxID=159855 RepID=UPI0034E53B7B
MDPSKVLCFLSEGEQHKRFKRRCIASAVDFNGQYLLLTSSSAIKDEDKKKNLILKRFSRKHFGRYTVEACFFEEFGEFTFLKIKGTPQDNGGNWDMRPLNLKLPSSENLKVLTSRCATEKFKFEFKCDGERGTIELISKRPIEETSIVGAPIIIEQSGRFSVIGVVGLTNEKQLCPCYLNKNILESSPSASSNKPEPRKTVFTRGKKRKKPDKDLNAPKNLSATISEEHQEKIQAENQNLPFHKVAKIFGNMGCQSTSLKKPQWSQVEEAEEDSERCMMELQQYPETDDEDSVDGTEWSQEEEAEEDSDHCMMELQQYPETDDEESVDWTEGSEESTGSAQSLQFPFGGNQSEEDDLSPYFHLSEAAKIIQTLRNLLACCRLATEEAREEALSLRTISDEATCEATFVAFLVQFDAPQQLTEVLRSLYQNVPIFSSEEQSNSEVECALNIMVSICIVTLKFSDFQYDFCKACGEAGMVRECLKLLRGLKSFTHELSDKWIILEDPEGAADEFSTIGDLGFNVLGVLHNLLKTENTKECFESCGAVETLLSFYRSQFPKYRMTALLCLAYFVDEKTNYFITEEPIKDVLKLLEGACNSDDRRCQGFSVTGIVIGLGYIARNDRNKRMIGQLGGISLLVAVWEGNTDLLGIMATFETLCMLSLDEENKAIIKANDDKGELKMLYNSSDEGIQHAASVGKNQSEEDDLSPYFHISKAAKIIHSLQNLLARGQLATEEARMKAISLRIISDEAACEATFVAYLVQFNAPRRLTKVLQSLYQNVPVFSSEEQSNSEVECALNVISSICIAILKFSDFRYKFCKASGEAGMVEECLKLLHGLKMCTHELSDKRIILEDPEGAADEFSTIGDLGFNVLGVLHNLLKTENTKECFESCGAVETLLSFYRSQFPKYRMTALLCLAYFVDEKTNYFITEDFSEPNKELLKLLEGACNSDDRRCQGFSVTGIVIALSYFVRNDRNKRMIGQLGGIPLLVALLEDKLCLLEVTAIRTLYMLSLDEENKAIMKANDHKGELKILYNSSDEGIQQAASDSEEHIMISYHWKYQKEMREVKTELESKGLRVWMDEDKMNGDTLETMARAIEKSSVFLMAMSRQYQSSRSCQSEASYAYELGKKIIPLMMEENYKPDGWLGLILATKHYMHFEKDPREGIQQLLKEITNLTAAEPGIFLQSHQNRPRFIHRD